MSWHKMCLNRTLDPGLYDANVKSHGDTIISMNVINSIAAAAARASAVAVAVMVAI